MSVIRISEAERTAILQTRPPYGGERDKRQREANRIVFQRIKSKYGIPSNRKIKVEIDSQGNPDYLVLKDKDSGLAIESLTKVSAPAWAEPPKVSGAAPKYQLPVPPPRDMYLEKAAPPPAVAGITARVGSINLEDASQLLRAEGDACDSFQASLATVDGTVTVKNGRLYFVL